MDKVKRTKIGTVVSDKMDKTIVVRVDDLKRHPKYKKSYKVSKKFKVHDENNEYHTGDKVEFEETKPLSKDKHFKAVRKV
jgi:small subunit ribosomal protein S17